MMVHGRSTWFSALRPGSEERTRCVAVVARIKAFLAFMIFQSRHRRVTTTVIGPSETEGAVSLKSHSRSPITYSHASLQF